MRKFIAVLLVVTSSSAFANEIYLGVIALTAGQTKSNSSTATPFTVPMTSKISIQCDADAYVSVGVSTTAPTMPGQGVLVTSGQLFLSSTEAGNVAYVWVYGAGATNCKVFVRRGDE